MVSILEDILQLIIREEQFRVQFSIYQGCNKLNFTHFEDLNIFKK